MDIYDHEDLVIHNWIEKSINQEILDAKQQSLAWTCIRPFLHPHEQFGKDSCCAYVENNRCSNSPSYISYCVRACGCIVWCELHVPDNIDDLPGLNMEDDDENT